MRRNAKMMVVVWLGGGGRASAAAADGHCFLCPASDGCDTLGVRVYAFCFFKSHTGSLHSSEAMWGSGASRQCNADCAARRCSRRGCDGCECITRLRADTANAWALFETPMPDNGCHKRLLHSIPLPAIAEYTRPYSVDPMDTNFAIVE